MLIDPEQIIKSAAPGTAIFSRVYRPEAHTDFLVREETEVINRLRNPIVTLRSGMFIQRTLPLIVVMFRIGENPDQTFETWWNYHQIGVDGHKYFEDMTTQDNFAIHLYGDSGEVEKSIQVNNSLKDFFMVALKKILAHQDVWQMHEFDDARDEIYQQYPTAGKLWKYLYKK